MTAATKDLRIVFMGTPAFAVSSLDILVKNGFHIAGVVTAPDKPAGRGLQVHQSAVKKYAAEHQLPVLQPAKLKDPAFLESLKGWQADLQVVVAFRMLPEVVWDMPPLGTLNLHGSLLPQYRGAAPINWAVINGETETGVTTFKLQHDIDTGNILFQEKIPIGPDETAGELHDKMQETGARLLLKTVRAIRDGQYHLVPQTALADKDVPLKHAPKIFKEDGHIHWKRSVADIYNLVRGLSPYPCAWTLLHNKTLKIFAAKKETGAPLKAPGSFDTDGKTYLRYACNDGWLQLLDVQLEGKKRLLITDFLRGYRFRKA